MFLRPKQAFCLLDLRTRIFLRSVKPCKLAEPLALVALINIVRYIEEEL